MATNAKFELIISKIMPPRLRPKPQKEMDNEYYYNNVAFHVCH